MLSFPIYAYYHLSARRRFKRPPPSTPPPQKPSPTGSESIIPRRGVDVSPFITSLGLSSSTNRAPLLSDCAVEKKMQRQGNVIIIRKAEIEVEGARVGGGVGGHERPL